MVKCKLCLDDFSVHWTSSGWGWGRMGKGEEEERRGGERTEETVKEEGGVRRVGESRGWGWGWEDGWEGWGCYISIEQHSVHYLPRIFQEIDEIIPRANL